MLAGQQDHNTAPVLRVAGLKTHFSTPRGTIHAVDNVSFTLEAGRVLCIVGESGSGKSVTARSIMRLIAPPGKIKDGEVSFFGENLLELSEKRIRELRGDRISMVFQNPITSLNPGMSVGDQIMESLILHHDVGKTEARHQAIELMRLIGIPAPEERIDDHPARFSGGMRQRIQIAAAVACKPDVLIADEPTTALDVSMQAQILKVLKDTQDEIHNSIILITHDLAVVAGIADDVLVMYAGRAVEYAPVETIFDDPRHPYTQGLIETVRALEDSQRELLPIPGTPAIAIGDQKGCAFAPRCRYAQDDLCRFELPKLEMVGPGHAAACHVKPQMGSDVG